ncbi:MAG: hypothetical protein DRI95_02725 [Bacteroidetes bacterium]|nr:MAG: hypothetical protein DRI95_02725 [Bacteroidota bacterium]
MRNIFLALIITVTLQSYAQIKDSEHKQKINIEKPLGVAPWTSLNLNNDPAKFQFAIVTDRTGGHRPGIFMDAVHKLNLLQPEFVMSVGDLIEGYTTDIVELNRQWDEFDSFVQQLEMPFFYLPGNHDITNQVMEDLWKKRLGQTYYHFVYKDILFLMLNSEDQRLGAGQGTISEPQYKYIEQTLSKNTDVKWTLLFMHQPLWHQTDTEYWKNVEELLAKRKHTVFVGHEHRYVKTERNNGKYFVLATTGGYSPLRGTELGEFDHVVWVTMTKKGPIIANLQLEGIFDENIVNTSKQNYIKRVSAKSPLQIQAIFIEGKKFKSETTEIKITNDEDVPMNVKFSERFSWDLVGILEQIECNIPPNSVKKVKLTLKARKNTYEDPFKLKADVFYKFEDAAENLEIPFTYNIKPLDSNHLTKLNRNIKIDGQADDWGKLSQNWTTHDQKLNVSFDVGYNDKMLFVAAFVNDKKIVTFGEGHTWSQDAIGIIINADPKNKSTMSIGRGWYQNEILIPITPATDKIKSVIGKDLPKGALVKCQATNSGYFVEMALPIDYIKKRQSEDWKSLRFNLYIDNLDKKDVTRYWWQPDWRGSDNIIGSGMFFK